MGDKLLFRYLNFIIILTAICFATFDSPDLMDKSSGVEHIAMGSAGCARPTPLSAPYWNPAGLVYLNKDILGINYYKNLDAINHLSFDSAFVFENRYIGLNFVQEEVPDIPKTIEMGGEGVKQGTFSDLYRMYNLSTAIAFDESTNVGLNFKLLTREIDLYTASGMGIDVGILKRITENLTLGANFKNMVSNINWNTGKAEYLEKKIVTGLSFSQNWFDREGYIDLDYEIFINNTAANTWFIGMETWVVPDMFALRWGTNGYKDLTLGTGFIYYDLHTNLAYVIKDKETQFGNVFLFSVGFNLKNNSKTTTAKEITAEANATAIKNVKVENNTIRFELENFNNVAKIAIIDPKKDVTYHTSVENLVTTPYTIKGEYVFFIQYKDNSIVKQRISL